MVELFEISLKQVLKIAMYYFVQILLSSPIIRSVHKITK